MRVKTRYRAVTNAPPPQKLGQGAMTESKPLKGPLPYRESYTPGNQPPVVKRKG